MRLLFFTWLFAAIILPGRATPLDDDNVVWSSPSANALESMPCGGGDIGLNVWVEHGDLLIYLARSGTFDELNGMPKLGRLRLRLSPNPWAKDAVNFTQELRLHPGFVRIHGEAAGVTTDTDVWVDVFRPVIHVVIRSSVPTAFTADYENWRLADRQQTPAEMGPNRSYIGAPEPAIVRSDTVGFSGDTVRFYHRNTGRTDFDLVTAQQGLAACASTLWNPLVNLTFGGEMSGPGLVADRQTTGHYASADYHGWRLSSAADRTTHALQVVLHTAQTPTLAAWADGLAAEVRATAATDPATARAATESWWADFWARSHIFIHPATPDPASEPWQVGRNYQIFRYQLGCNARGEYPTKFNGGLFTVDPEFIDPKLPFTPDFRLWGGGSFTAQNQRLVYWPLLKSGDTDLMRPQFEFYRRALGNAETRSKVYWGIDGASFTEQIENFGLPVAFEYNWHRRPGAEVGIEDSDWVNFQWDTVFEFCGMNLESRRYAGADITAYLPLIESCLRFYDQFYQQRTLARTGHRFSDDGKLVLFPATACETYKDALNPASTLAALHGVLTRLLALPSVAAPGLDRKQWQTLLDRLPALPTREFNGHSVIAPAASWSRVQNVELPQLYPVFPWAQYGIGRHGLGLARDTWLYGFDRPDQKQIISWHQDAIFCARLGLTKEAAALTLAKLRDSGRRFPTWWGPGHDWVPDHNWGGSGMIGLQDMLLQDVGRQLYVLPAWPADWDVDAKLHAPENTTVELTVKEGRLQRLVVTPAARAADVVLPPGWTRPSS